MSENKYNAIFIIGNGFDLNLKLPTSYQDFIASDIFNDLLADNNQLCLYLNNQNKLNNWIDIENELKEYSYNVNKDLDRKVFKQEYQKLCNSLCEYLNNLNMSKIDETSNAYKYITNYAREFKDLLIINFNYTSSIDYIANKNNLSPQIVNVHGRAENNKIVFGVEDNARINANDIFLKKSTCLWNPILNIDSILSNENNIVFLGYSLGETDHHYFKQFFSAASINNFLNKTRKSIYISYYKEDGKDDIFKQIDALTSNRILGLRTHQNFKMMDWAEKV
ncbi:MAG: bacteriophage abortive infection AbiH family protein [Firmicutes bacterium]|nr:bacteriophage abortive infection AbiH family protein [Bacillota bacterium]